jgi:hypothetical protein
MLDSGVRELNEVERLLAGEPAHRSELRRRLQEVALDRPGTLGHARSEQLWARTRETWREAHAPLIAARRALIEAGVDDHPSLVVLRAAVEERLAEARSLGEATPWAAPGPDEREGGRGVSGLHSLDALVAGYLDELGREGSTLRAVGHQAAEEIRTRGRARWASWAAAPGQGPPPWERWRNRALFPTILARVLWLGPGWSASRRRIAEPLQRMHCSRPVSSTLCLPTSPTRERSSPARGHGSRPPTQRPARSSPRGGAGRGSPARRGSAPHRQGHRAE